MNRDHDDPQDPWESISACPVCGGPLDTVYQRQHQKVCACIDCHTGITIPSTAWEVARAKRAASKRQSPEA
jgi:ssDNA-binding Zn-finger/Zn-ribbon topoisomerase 1